MAYNKKMKGGATGPCHVPPKATKKNSPMIHGGKGDSKAMMPPDASTRKEWHAAKAGRPGKGMKQY